MVEPKYRLIAEDVPAITKATVYEKILDEFAAGKEASVRVEIPKKKPATIHQGLLKTKKVNPRFSGISIVRRQEAIYLKK